MTMNLAVVDLAEKRASAFIRKGQRAWTAIRATAEEQRVLWLEVGVALMYGKQKENREAGQKFSDWVQVMFPGLADKTASDALWFAANSGSLPEIPAAMSHPEWIRKWFNDHEATLAIQAALPVDAPEVTVETAPKFPTQRDAEKFIKVDQRADSGDQGSDTADRMRKAIAATHGTTVEDLRKEASAAAPDAFYRFTPTALKSIDSMRANLRGSAAAMELDGISKAAIRNIFLQFANSL